MYMEECLPAVVYEGGEQIMEYCLKKIIIIGFRYLPNTKIFNNYARLLASNRKNRIILLNIEQGLTI